jgi:ATP-dependent RNA helicase DDX31/DBP7
VKEGSFGRRQNVMVSATLSKGVEKLAGLTLTDPEHIKLSEDDSVNQDQLVTPTNLKQWYLIVPPKLRLATLAAFILWKCTVSLDS